MPDSILIFSETSSPRLAWVCALIFDQRLGIPAKITVDIEEYIVFSGPKVLYRKTSENGGLHICPAGILFESSIEPQKIDSVLHNGLSTPFATATGIFPFDPFAAIFYLVSRYEEYLPHSQNQYGQFRAADAMAYQSGFLHQPVVDIWINELKAELLKLYPAINFTKKTYSSTFTYDIDVAYAYLGRGFKATAGNILRDLLSFNIKKIIVRLKVLLQLAPDPFDTYSHIQEQKALNKHDLIFFFLLGTKNAFNHNIDPEKKVLQQLIKRLAKTETIGIHPSFYADAQYALLGNEKKILEAISKKTITNSRQHYLRLIWPQTYNNLIEAGIEADYTLGFAEAPGFRAGTCHPFYFYDVQNETATDLLLYPVSFMEGTFIEDMQLTPEAALPIMQQLVDEVKKVNGNFVSIWHNHSLSDQEEWKGLKNIHDAIARYAAP
ncbi:MAG: polysaccharide deacetylase family protein [Ferruginibacter sp.]